MILISNKVWKHWSIAVGFSNWVYIGAFL
jgi:hypothetical protein